MATRIYDDVWVFEDKPQGPMGPGERDLRRRGPQNSVFSSVEAWEKHVARVRYYEQHPDIET